MEKNMLKILKDLQSENEYFRRQLSAINTPQKLARYSLFFCFLAFLSLSFTKFLGIDLLHPILAYFVFGISTVFYLMAFIMKRQGK